MSTERTPNQTRVIRDLLGWDDDLRPTLAPRPGSPELADRIRDDLERRLGPAAERFVERPLTVSKWDITSVLKCEGLFVAPSDFEWNPANVRGKVVHRAVQISYAGRGRSMTPMDLVEHAVEAFQREDGGVGDYLRAASPAELSEVVTGSTSAVTTFISDWPAIRPSMIPRIESPANVPLCGGRIVLKGRYDLALGPPGQASIIVDLKTGDEYPEHAEEARHYALLETLKHRVPPYRVATYYSDSSWFRTQDVDEGALESAARRTADAVNRISEVWWRERAPVLTPGQYCRYCPARPDCETGQHWIAQQEQTSARGEG